MLFRSLKPALSAVIMGLVVWVLRSVLPFHRVFTILEVGVGVAVYALAAVWTGAANKEDLRSLTSRLRRKGRKA